MLLTGPHRQLAIEVIKQNHYTGAVPSGKSHYFQFDDALVVWSIPANKNIARFLLKYDGVVWELSRLWAPDGHRKNLLTWAISQAVSGLREIEPVDALVSYADPQAGHSGGVYRAASWIYHGQSEESRMYRNEQGAIFSRRAFHSGGKSYTKLEIENMGYEQIKVDGKFRFVKPLTKKARKQLRISAAAMGA